MICRGSLHHRRLQDGKIATEIFNPSSQSFQIQAQETYITYFFLDSFHIIRAPKSEAITYQSFGRLLLVMLSKQLDYDH